MNLKKSNVICFIGTDGAGKSTLVREVAKAYEESFNIKVNNVYFGWEPFLPLTKLMSFLFRKKEYRIAESMNKKKARFSFLQEIMLFYYYIEYMARYLFKIKFKKGIFILDRHFYDMYAHYDYSRRSVLFKHLINLFQKPDFIFFLDVDVETAKKRKPELDIELIKKHRDKYLELSNIINLKRIDTAKPIEECVKAIMNEIK